MTLLRETDFAADIAGSTATVADISVGDTFYGRVSVAGDKDWLRVTLQAGQTYALGMTGVGPNATMLRDTYIQIFAADGITALAKADDTTQNMNSVLSFTAPETGVYYIAMGHFRDTPNAADTRTGDYALNITDAAKPSFTLDMIANVMSTRTPWAATGDEGVTLTYGFREASDKAGFQPFAEAQRADTQWVLSYYSEIANLHFVQTTGDTATLLYANYSANDGFGAYGMGPNNTDPSASDGDFWDNNSNPAGTKTGMETSFRSMTLHEIGHTMGLSHPGSYNAGLGVTNTYQNSAQFAEDSAALTVMSYFDADETGQSDLRSDTLMIADILALQNIYGANFATRAGNSVYGFGADTGEVYDFDLNLAPNLAIWDGGGTDTLDVSRSFAAQNINLADGTLSDVLGYIGNVGIAVGAVIENAMGGAGADRLSGNTAANNLTGGAGDDTLYGHAGDDTLYGGAGTDQLFGGAGNDALSLGAGADIAPETLQLLATAPGVSRMKSTNVELFRTPSFTIEMLWQQATLANEGYQVKIGNFQIFQYETGLASISVSGADSGNGWHYGAINASLGDGALHRLSISYDDATGLMKIYIDGLLTEIWEHPAGALNLLGNGVVDITESAAFGDIRIWNGVRSGAQIYDTAASALADPMAETDLVQYWVANGAGGMVSAIGGADLTVTGAATMASGTLWVQGAGLDTLAGGAGDDSYTLTSQDAVIVEGEGEGVGEGTDTLYTSMSRSLENGLENVTALGALGLQLTGNALANQMVGAVGEDTLYGGDNGDRLYGRDGDDRLYGQTGDDRLSGAAGIDRLYADAGNDTAYGGADNDIISGGADADSLYGGSGLDLAYGGSHNDTVYGSSGNDTVYGGSSDDRIYGGSENDLLFGGSQADHIYGVDGSDLAYGGLDADRVFGGFGDDTLFGSDGRDTVEGGSANDCLYGGAQDDTLAGGTYNDLIYGGSGNDSLDGGTGRDTLFGGSGTDILRGGVDSSRDVFVFTSAAVVGVGAARDVIHEFTTKLDDVDVHLIDANTKMGGDQAFAYAGAASAHSLWAQTAGADIVLCGDVNGDAIADFEILFVTVSAIGAGDFIL